MSLQFYLDRIGSAEKMDTKNGLEMLKMVSRSAFIDSDLANTDFGYLQIRIIYAKGKFEQKGGFQHE